MELYSCLLPSGRIHTKQSTSQEDTKIRMLGNERGKLVVVGGGIIGLSTAYFAQEKGWDVTLVDRGQPTSDGCSLGNSGMIVPSHFVPLAAPGTMGQAIRWMKDPESPFSLNPSLSLDMLKWGLRFFLASTKAQVDQAAPLLRDLNLASRELYVKWAESGIDSGLVQKGLLMLCNTSHMMQEEVQLALHAQKLGVPAEVLNAEQTAALDPNIDMAIEGAVYYPKDCHLSPDKLLQSLRKKLELGGCKFLWGQHATDFVTRGRTIQAVRTSQGEVTGDKFVVAGGVWSDSLVKAMGLSIPMLAGKGYSLTLSAPVQLPAICSILCEAKVAVTPMGSRLRFGGTMTIGKPDNVISPEKLNGIKKSVVSYFPKFSLGDFQGIQPWVGLRPVTPDGLPYIGKSKDWDNIAIAAGHAMMGLSLGPITGQLIAQLISDERTSIPVERLTPDRYAA